MDNKDLINKLEKAGLSEKAATVYASLIEHGGAYPSSLSLDTHINRSTVYKILLDLSIKGLVSEITRGKKLYYQVENPDRLVRFSKDRVFMATKANKEVEQLIPELEAILSKSSDRPMIKYYQDKKGIMSVYEDMVSVGNYEMLAISHGEAFKNFLTPKELVNYVKSKESKNITTRGIIPDTKGNRSYGKDVFKGIKKSVWPSVRYLPKDRFPFQAEITLYANKKVAITKLHDHKMVGVTIEDQVIHDLLKMIFDLLWVSDQVSK